MSQQLCHRQPAPAIAKLFTFRLQHLT